jgi:hypothetical protein
MLSPELHGDQPHWSHMTDSSQQSRTPLPVELRYFAAPRDDWELLLLRARQVGADTIAARVPWAWHAPTSTTFDFAGATDEQRDLIGFVRLCGRLGLHILLDPGPLHRALLGAGAPAWLLKQHPSARALGPNGAPWLDPSGLPVPNTQRPEFLEAARDWIARFSAAMRALQAPAGPIIGLRAGAPDAFAAGQSDSIAATTIDWLLAEGWTVPLRYASAFQEQAGLQEYSPVLRSAGPSGAQLIELPGGPGNPLLDAAPADALLRADGSARPDFWRVKMTSLLANTAGDIGADPPADLALASASAPRHPDKARAVVAALEQRLRQASVAFDIIELDTLAPGELARYALIALPESLALHPATQQKLAQCSNMVLLSEQANDRDIEPPRAGQLARVPADISADQLAELIEERGGIARYAWADGANVDLTVRYGACHAYLSIDNRRPVPYNGILAYRGRDGAVLHVHAGIGAHRSGMLLLTDDEVYGAAIDGDGAEGGWLARGLRSSAVFNSGAGALVRCGEGLLLTAPQSGRFQARRPEGWPNTRAYRLLLGGALLPAAAQIDATHIAVAYVAEDARGQTDMYLVLPNGAAPPLVRSYLATLLAARAALLRRAATLAQSADEPFGAIDSPDARTTAPFTSAAAHLEAAAKQFATLDEYSAAWSHADELCQPAIAALAQTLTQARGALLAGRREPAAHAALEQRIARITQIVARIG